MFKLYTLKEVAGILNINPATLRSWCRKGKIAHIKIGRLYRFKENHIVEFLKKDKEGQL